ncbi:unnamed protein product [Didymodactylos carnosus]|uniref:TIR domain-containing protein n=1 Tax=Didymodactylos carnosus TaxID=1234261 RepID=A0A814TIM4_9BILA|nr:unnamed protein product [Didymodactylos carnosus]CAF1162233.1 unnamed protein product [Didymodactylos carnosus]CAF3532885.1 unnamed protein product [Didymodactylos carnosus]CAF3925783.1 unnamed protein product [Didymodactylos carnosus]
MNGQLTEVVDTRTKRNKEKSDVFNGKKEFQILENSLEAGDDYLKIEESCEKLIKNSECLLEFNYSTNEKEFTQLTSLIYIIQFVLRTINKHRIYLEVKSLKQFLLEVVPEIATLDIINELLNKDKLRSCKIFKQLFEIINKTENFSKYFQLYKNTTNITVTDNIATISLKSIDNEEDSTSNNNNHEENELSICQYYESIFDVILTLANQALFQNDMYESNDLEPFKITLTNFKNYLTLYFCKHENDQLSQLLMEDNLPNSDHTLCLSILLIIWNFVDKPIFVSAFIETGYAKAVLDWIQLPFVNLEHKRSFVSIIHNLVRQKQGQNAFKQENAIVILDKIRSTIENYQDFDMNIVYYMGLILIDGHELIETFLKQSKDSIKNILNTLFNKNVRACRNLIKHKELKYHGFHLSELLVVLEKLFISDFIVKYFLTNGEPEIDRVSSHHLSSLSSSSSSISSLTSSSISSESSTFLLDDKKDSIKIFSDALLSIYGTVTHGDDRGKLACESLMKILWSITFYSDDEQIKQQLKSNGILIFLLHSLSEIDHKVAEIAKCILHNLHEILPSSLSKSASLYKIPEPFVLFCYSSQDEQSVKQLIHPQTFTVYPLLIDDDNNEIKSWDEIKFLVIHASIFVVVATKYSYSSRYCRQIAKYALELKKEKIVLKKNYTTQGWFESLTSANANIHNRCIIFNFTTDDDNLEMFNYEDRMTILNLNGEIASIIEENQKFELSNETIKMKNRTNVKRNIRSSLSRFFSKEKTNIENV